MSVNAPQASSPEALPEHRANSVLIIDADPQRGRNLGFLLQCMDHPHFEVVDCNNWQAAAGEPGNLLCIIVGDCGSLDDSLAIAEAFQERAEDVPVMLMHDVDSEPELSSEQAAAVVAHISYPPNTNQLLAALSKVQTYRASHQSTDHLRPMKLFRSLVGHSKSIQHVRKLMEHVAGSDANVLIFGDSGTGKEVVARNLHYHSERRDKPFVPVNCGAIPADLLESELFGHEKGAFTGAISTRQGRFELAEGGTLFLDEIGDISPLIQLKLLRFLEQKEYERVGESKTHTADVRIIAATNVDLREAVRSGVFREDLYYRLNVMPVGLPPLRERQADIPLLVEHFLETFSGQFNKSFGRISEEVMDLFMRYPWPGNIRELRHTLEHACILSPGGEILLKHMRRDLVDQMSTSGFLGASHVQPSNEAELSIVQPASHISYAHLVPSMHKAGKQEILDALQQCGGNKAKAARQLGIHRATIYRKLKAWGLEA